MNTVAARTISDLAPAERWARGLLLTAALLLMAAAFWQAWALDRPTVQKAKIMEQTVIQADDQAIKVQSALMSWNDLGTIVMAWHARTGNIIYSSATCAAVLGINYQVETQNIASVQGTLDDLLTQGDWQEELVRTSITRRNDAQPRVTVSHRQRSVPVEIQPRLLWWEDHVILVAKVLTVDGRPYALANMVNERPDE